MQNTPLGCICRVAGCRASRLLLSFFLSKRKEQRKMRPPVRNGGVSPVATGDQGAALTPSPSGTWATPSPLKRAALNFRPYGSVCGAIGPAWSLRLVGAAPIQSVKGRGIVLPCTRSDSRHPLNIRTVLSRVAASRVWMRPPGRWGYRRTNCFVRTSFTIVLSPELPSGAQVRSVYQGTK